MTTGTLQLADRMKVAQENAIRAIDHPLWVSGTGHPLFGGDHMRMILCTLLLLSQTAPQTAGERYKSVSELRDIPASQVIEVMSVIAGSLGVTCAHCHTEDWASDEKPNKVKARQMIAMTRRIDREFGGTGAITCNTCHQGHAVPLSVSRVENAGWNKPAAAPAIALPALDDVLQKYLTGVTRGTAIDKSTTLTLSGSVTRRNGRTADASGPFKAIIWLAGSLKMETPLSFPPEASGELALALVRPARLREIYPRMTVSRRDRVGDRDAIVVTATTASAAVHELFFDSENGLLLRRYDEKPTVLGPLPEMYDLRDYRDAPGIRIPRTIQWSRADYRVTFSVTYVQ